MFSACKKGHCGIIITDCTWQVFLAWILSSSFCAGLAGTDKYFDREVVLGEIIHLCLTQTQYWVNIDSRLLTKRKKLVLWSFISLNNWEAFACSEFLNIKLPKCIHLENHWHGHNLAELSLHQEPVEGRHVFWAPGVTQGSLNRLWPLLVCSGH